MDDDVAFVPFRRIAFRYKTSHTTPLATAYTHISFKKRTEKKRKENSTHSKPIQRLRRALIDINAPNAALRTRRVLIEPYRGGVVRDGHLERRDRGAVVGGARAGVEAVERGVVVVLRDAWRGEYRLDHVVCAVRDCVIERLVGLCLSGDVRYAVRKVAGNPGKYSTVPVPMRPRGGLLSVAYAERQTVCLPTRASASLTARIGHAVRARARRGNQQTATRREK